MQASIVIARLIGPLFAVVGLGMLVNTDVYRAVAGEFLGSIALIYLTGVIGLVAGLAVLTVHNVWTRDWRTIITVFGWLAVIGGVARIVTPRFASKVGTFLLAQPAAITIAAIVILIAGAFISFKGYRA